MKTNSKLLVDALSIVNGVVQNANTLPILENVLFELNHNELTLTGSDLENTLVVNIEVESEQVVNFCTDGKKLVEFLKSVGNEPINLNIGSVLEIVTNNGKYELPLQDASEYPSTPVINENTTTINGEVLKNGFVKTSNFTGTDDLRPIMTGVYLHGNNFVSTDAHVLSKYTTDVQINGEFIIPKKAVNVLRSVLHDDDITINYNQTNIQFTSGSVTLVSRLIDGKYPNYDAVIPKENYNTFKFNRKDLLSTLKRLSVFANKQTNQIKFTFGNEIVIESQDVDYNNKGREVFNGEYVGETIVIGFNSRYLSSIISNFDDEYLTLQMSEPNRASIIESNGLLNLIMPVLV